MSGLNDGAPRHTCSAKDQTGCLMGSTKRLSAFSGKQQNLSAPPTVMHKLLTCT